MLFSSQKVIKSIKLGTVAQVLVHFPHFCSYAGKQNIPGFNSDITYTTKTMKRLRSKPFIPVAYWISRKTRRNQSRASQGLCFPFKLFQINIEKAKWFILYSVLIVSRKISLNLLSFKKGKHKSGFAIFPRYAIHAYHPQKASKTEQEQWWMQTGPFCRLQY